MPRKHSPGCTCCAECCGTVELPDELEPVSPLPFDVQIPADWSNFGSECCKTLEITYTSPAWNYVCSDPTHVEMIEAEVEWALKLHPRVFVEAPAGFTEDDISCSTTKGGDTVCNIGGVTIPVCDGSGKFTCMTITENRQVTRSRILVVRWRPIKITLRAMRTETQCTGDTEVKCKYIVFAFLECELEYLHAQKFNEVQSLTLDTGPCCGYTLVDGDTCSVSTGRQYCTDYTDLDFATATVVDGLFLVRSKAFDELPTGSISFAPGDQVDCTPTDAAAVACSGNNFTGAVDSVEIESSDTSFFAYPGFDTPGSGIYLVEDALAVVGCSTTIVYDDGSCSQRTNTIVDPRNYLESSGWVSQCSLTGEAFSTFFLNENPLQFVENPSVDPSCESDYCGGTNLNESHHLTATRLDKSRTTSGYTARSIIIDGGTWTFNLVP